MTTTRAVILGTLVALAAASTSTPSNAYLITTDESYFNSLYTVPTEVIDFTRLKDDTEFELGLLSNPLVNQFSTAGPHYDVWEYGWSESFLLRTRIGASSFNTVTRWYGSYVTPDYQSGSRFSLIFPGEPVPVGMVIESDAYTGFLGLIPESRDTEYDFAGYANTTLNELRIGYQEVPVPGTLALILFGLLGFIRANPGRKGC